ncbi:MAG: hypothetical protein KME13_27070 [Myxacorys californica WJT36-NPBG1]|jgi:hypothetical protein|nr:hypothetical protein [Myxacorys californica WJT36-NPBG1]
MSQQTLRESDLAQFTGSGVLYRHGLFRYHYTEGVQYVAQCGCAYWLIDAIFSWQREQCIREDVMLQEIQFWTLQVHDDRSATLTCERDSNDVAITQSIPWTDFPLSSIRLYFQEGVLLLPSEY